jgi:hypothetical protein
MGAVLRLGLVVVLMSLSPLLARAQSGPDLSDLVVDWAHGRYASPVMCELDGELVRGIRRVILREERTPGRAVMLLVQFVDMRPGEAARCVNATGQPQPNILGKVLLRLEGTPHPETAARDFKQTLKRDRGFELEIARGALKLQAVSRPPAGPQLVDFQGGRATLRLVMPATDADLELAAFQSPRKLLLELQPKKGEKLTLPISLVQEE